MLLEATTDGAVIAGLAHSLRQSRSSFDSNRRNPIPRSRRCDFGDPLRSKTTSCYDLPQGLRRGDNVPNEARLWKCPHRRMKRGNCRRTGIASSQRSRRSDRCVTATVELPKRSHVGRRPSPFCASCFSKGSRAVFSSSRRRAVEALAALGARDVLIEFLESSPDIADPVERLGEDAVMNAAARSLRELRDPRALQLFLSLVRRRPLSGVMAALGGFQAPETIPYFIDALAEDECRPEAEAALRKMASLAHDALIVTALQDPTRQDRESEFRLRQRRSALALLVQTGVRSNEWASLRNIMEDEDPKLVALACRLCLACAPELERREAIDRLRRLLPTRTSRCVWTSSNVLRNRRDAKESAEQSPRSTRT